METLPSAQLLDTEILVGGDAVGIIGIAAGAEEVALTGQAGAGVVEFIHGIGKLACQGIQGLLIVGDAPLDSGIGVGGHVRVGGKLALLGQKFPLGLQGAVQIIVQQFDRIGIGGVLLFPVGIFQSVQTDAEVVVVVGLQLCGVSPVHQGVVVRRVWPE